MGKNLKIVLLTGLCDEWIAELVKRFRKIEGVQFEDVLYWHPEQPLGARIRKNIKKHGLLYVPWRLAKLVNDRVAGGIRRAFESFLLAPRVREDLFSACRDLGINLHRLADVHAPESLELIRSLDCDLILVCGTGILRKSVIALPKLGAINLHQGEVPRYRGAPPGFWELWNREAQAGVTVHYVDEGVDTGDVVLQRLIPIFEYDDHELLRKKLAEVSLDLYPEAVRRIANGTCRRTRQLPGAGRQYTFPRLSRMLQLSLRMKARTFNFPRFAKDAAKKIFFLLVLLLISVRDLFLRLQGKNILAVLYYHRVTDLCRDGMTAGVDAFEKQVRFLKKHYRVLAPAELPGWLAGKQSGMGEKAVLITFDDGYEDNYTNAFRILKKYSCPALFFLSTAYLGNERQFEHDAGLQPRLRFGKMSWDQVRDALRHGIEAGIHSDDHCDLGGVSPAEAIRQIERSIEAFAGQTGRKPLFMSYPFGQKRNITRPLVEYVKRSGIAALFCAYGNKNISPMDPYNLNRVNVGSNDEDLLIFGYKTEGELRTLLQPYERLWPDREPRFLMKAEQ